MASFLPGFRVLSLFLALGMAASTMQLPGMQQHAPADDVDGAIDGSVAHAADHARTQTDAHGSISGGGRGAGGSGGGGGRGRGGILDGTGGGLAYDFSRSTEENHASTTPSPFVGPHSYLRSTLDYSYHQYYSTERQATQDAILEGMMTTIVRDSNTHKYCSRPVRPWVVFTAGAMGSGKSWTMRWLQEQGYFPLESFVVVDPDAIRYQLPETPSYVERDTATAGSLTHKESGYIAELLTLQALELGKNVVVDGSLRDAEWHATYFDKLRQSYPTIRIAILHVTASPEEVLKRAARRAATTRREIPRETLLSTIDQVPLSVRTLTPLAEYVITIRNKDGEEPSMEATAGGVVPSVSLSAPTSVKIPIQALGHGHGLGHHHSGKGGATVDDGDGSGGDDNDGGCSESWEAFTTIWLQECRKEESFESRSVLEVKSVDHDDGYGALDFPPPHAVDTSRRGEGAPPSSPRKSNL